MSQTYRHQYLIQEDRLVGEGTLFRGSRDELLGQIVKF